MTRCARTPARVLAATLAVAVLASACSGDKKAPASSSTPAPSGSASASSSSAPASTPAARNPFTGIGKVPTTPTIAVKVDDTAPGRPQVGIDRADIVYIEEAEGGLSRLLAVFGTNTPSSVGYVRSTRPSDPDLLLQYGRITEAASGGGHDALPLLDKSGIKGWINDRGAGYYSRVSRSESSYINLVLDLKRVAATARTATPRDIGLRFGAALPAGAGSGRDVRTTVGSTAVEFRWSPTLKKYVRYIGGTMQRAADGKPVATSNVVVQACKIVPHPQDSDVNGMPSQFTITVGTGRVVVFRNGKRLDGTWSRKSLNSGTTLTGSNGKPLTLMPGNTWFALIHPTTHVSG